MNTMEIICSLTDSEQYRIFCCKENNRYSIKISRLSHTWFYDLCDLIDFYENTGIRVVLNVSEKEVQSARDLYGAHRFDEPVLRSYEPKVLVHSAPKDSADSILMDKELKCWNVLKAEKEGWEESPIGDLLGDIEDFSNYIMFADMEFNNEIIVASKQKQKIDISVEQIYTPGARFYFDAEKMAGDGLLLRDGEHIKVKNRIPLEKYMIWYATAEKIGMDSQTTPRQFWEKSNEVFRKKFPEYGYNK